MFLPPPASQQVIQNRAQRIDVTSFVHLVEIPAPLLGGHVAERPEDCAPQVRRVFVSASAVSQTSVGARVLGTMS